MNHKKQSRFAYGLMVFFYRIHDAFSKPDEVLNGIGLKKGFTVADIGCGPGRYVRQAAAMVGDSGRVYAVDIHETAVKIVKRIVATEKLDNVTPVLNSSGLESIPSGSVDIAYALDMFHAVDDAVEFLREVRRILKATGRFILEDGHQPREKTKNKLASSGEWRIESENERYVILNLK